MCDSKHGHLLHLHQSACQEPHKFSSAVVVWTEVTVSATWRNALFIITLIVQLYFFVLFIEDCKK